MQEKTIEHPIRLSKPLYSNSQWKQLYGYKAILDLFTQTFNASTFRTMDLYQRAHFMTSAVAFSTYSSSMLSWSTHTLYRVMMYSALCLDAGMCLPRMATLQFSSGITAQTWQQVSIALFMMWWLYLNFITLSLNLEISNIHRSISLANISLNGSQNQVRNA